jgi:hypothetical protein
MRLRDAQNASRWGSPATGGREWRRQGWVVNYKRAWRGVFLEESYNQKRLRSVICNRRSSSATGMPNPKSGPVRGSFP